MVYASALRVPQFASWWRVRGRRAGGALAAREAREDLADVGPFAFGDENLRQRAVVGRLDVGVDFVGLDREERLAFVDRIARFLVPGGASGRTDGALGP